MDDVDQLLDDALEESYRSVLEESSHSSMSNPSSMVNPGGKKQNGDPNLVSFYFLLACNVFVARKTKIDTTIRRRNNYLSSQMVGLQ